MFKKKSLIIASAFVLFCLAFTSCSSDGANDITPESNSTADTESSTDTKNEPESETATDPDWAPGTEPESETPTETEGESNSEAPTETEDEPDSETGTETESEGATEEPSEPPHTHNYTVEITTEATCGKAGTQTFTCECGHTYTETIKAKEHNYVTDNSTKIDATCTKEGKKADQICSLCGDIKKGTTISKKSHSYGEYVYNNDATQTADGTKSRTCSVCGKVDTKTATGTKLPADPSTYKAVTSLDDIPLKGTITNSDNSAYTQVIKDIKAGKYEKIRYIASNGDQFCMWNVRLKDERINFEWEKVTYYWFVAPINDQFSNGDKYANYSKNTASELDGFLIAVGNNISSPINECMLNRNTDIPLSYRTINTTDCPVSLYELVETDTMLSVWVEGTNCIQEGIGTCGKIQCDGTCLRSKITNELQQKFYSKGWTTFAGGEAGRINWNGKLLVQYYYMKY